MLWLLLVLQLFENGDKLSPHMADAAEAADMAGDDVVSRGDDDEKHLLFLKKLLQKLVLLLLKLMLLW